MRCCLYFPLLLYVPLNAQEPTDLPADNASALNETEPEQSPLENFNDETFKDFFENQNRLVEYLFKDYKNKIPAFYLGDSGLFVIGQTNDCFKDEPKQSLTIIAEVFIYWVDPRLAWNPEEFNGATEIAINRQDTVWVPDVLPVDTLSYQETIPLEVQIANIKSDGIVSLYWTAVIEFVCPLNLGNFPFDRQTCTLRFTSFNGFVTEFMLAGFVTEGLPMEQLGNGEWAVTNVSVSMSRLPGAYNNSFDIIQWEIGIKRSSTFYVMLMIIPSFILTVLCVFGLFWESVDGQSYMDNLNLGFAAILAMMFILQMTTQTLPKINQIDKLSRYSMVNLGLIAFASVLVMIMGKSVHYQTIVNPQEGNFPPKKKYSEKIVVVVQKLHVIFMVGFVLCSLINLCVLVI